MLKAKLRRCKMIRRKQTRTYESRKLTLEQRIARLERAVSKKRSLYRSVNEGLDKVFSAEVESAVANKLGDDYTVTVELDKDALFVWVEDEYEEGGGEFKIEEGPDGYVVSDVDMMRRPNFEIGTAIDAADIADIIAKAINNYW